LETPVVFHNNGEQIVGVFHHAQNASAARTPAVVFLHGFTGNKVEVRRVFVRTARALAARGIASLRFDFRGSGDSEGEFSQMRVSGLFADALTAFQYLKEQPGIDSNRVGVIGFSMGGMVASQLLSKESGIKAAVLWSPVAHPGSLIEDLDNWSTGGGRRGLIDLGGWTVSRAFVEEYAKASPIQWISESKIRAPILLIHGSEDESVPVDHSFDYEQAFKTAGSRVQLKVLEGAGHTYESIELDRMVVNHTVKWLQRHLNN